ncbi:hypothetical protein KI809_02095 [Geobacter pelophilus]|uniref:DUF5625 domain-containing protein n=1 Tax=Geoanaerobacter pelophilus TaxID=60036 RepID=A0AAW4KWJ8_9BACT|nr:hypothetical protein [Geoanaerobacter pelophilus]MBT0663079.1 hypothetical protein [Geoanaerobacter pelophilus]
MTIKMNVCMAGAALMLCVVASGCANNRELIAKTSLATRKDVFAEVASSDVQAGKSIIDFTFSVKSNSYRFAETYGKHSDPPYRVHLNIDGQTAVLEAEPVLEDKSPIDPNVPDSGTGWKYTFNKRFALTPGKHELTIALPIDDVIVEREIELRAGVNAVTVTPVYSKRMLRPYKGQNFTGGVKTVEVQVN